MELINSDQSNPLIIKLPPMTNLRRSTRHRTSSFSQASGSVYHESNNSMDVDLPMDEDAEGEDDPEEPAVEYRLSSRGRKVAKKSYKESEDEIDGLGNPQIVEPAPENVNDANAFGIEDEELPPPPRYFTRKNRTTAKPTTIMSSDEGESSGRRYATRSQSKKPDVPASNGGRSTRNSTRRQQPATPRTTRITNARSRISTRRSVREERDADIYVDEPGGSSASADGEFDEAARTSSDVEPEPEPDADADAEADVDGEGEGEPETDGRPYALRQRAKVNYAIPPPLEEISAPPKNRSGRSGGGGHAWNKGGAKKGPGWSATGAELGRYLGLPGDDSDSDAPGRSPRKGFGGAAFTGGVGAGPSAILPGDLATAAGTPSNFGKVGDAALADADPLGVNQNVTFDEVGGLDNHINSLKEMTLLPLLYPEVFQKFDLTPPRGVLFHGPPGTGKTLLARALAASCRSNGKGISFFMRKGADVLSKWVGEAERQLRLLFEEARNCQPSIIFFDEIDGLAPVRSSKQDQIHASIVSTLLALMDGMDGRGQVVVIGATNRPDAVDPALRRPGRFDREFYFPLPGIEAREKILKIMTRKWDGWEGEKGEDNVTGLAKLTKGYGGADLRALCTEAALNAVQRRYPQIYKSNERLLLKPETIGVELRDFMISIKTLEEAEWEDEDEGGSLQRELMLQSMETLRVYRPRIVLHGPVGMGQGYVGTATLHHLEGCHVQNLDLGTLMGDSTRSVEAAIVQLFVEAKRHQPSIIYIPSLVGWCAAVPETSRTTVRAMLDTLAPTDPILLLAVVDGPFLSLPRDVRSWFGPTRETRVEFTRPAIHQREAFFEGLLQDVQRPPNHFPDGMKRKKRVLEDLPLAPPLEPRQPTAAELAVQEEHDLRLITLLRFRLGPILTELKRKFKRFTKHASEEYNLGTEGNINGPAPPAPLAIEPVTTTTIDVQSGPNGVIEIVDEQKAEMVNGQVDVLPVIQQLPSTPPPPPPPPPPPQPKLFNMDLERMHMELYKNRYLTPQSFLDDVGKMVHNADVRMHEDPERLHRAQAMFTAAEVSIQDFDPQFRLECERMAVRERQRRQELKKEKEKQQALQDAEVNAVNGVNGEYAPGTRRSARQNGQKADITITDPLVLERRLKRQRSNEAGNDSPASGEEGSRSNKRSRVASEDRDPIDAFAQSGGVHFADDSLPPPLTPQPSHRNGDAPPIQTNSPLHLPPPTGGFDPSLLNPAPTEGIFAPSNPLFNHSPFLSTAGRSSRGQSQQPHEADMSDQLPVYQPSPMRSASPRAPAQDITSEATGATVELTSPTGEALSQVPETEPEHMEIERTPTPLPDFHISEDHLSHLRLLLRDLTERLSVEHLEQLRATCLGCVWHHRSDWDRDDLVRELQDVVKEFVGEVRADEDSEASSFMDHS
ncbi:hypothetical protein EW146_g3256 [Bondarzewia mesenterica]|uniref:AAA+ ATPase domain-containing protein n=1 Tax=Bondarzewia mesenterica TaxID=1095465 RepID=A0A4V3XFH7_9AGAM|nr:hypothetical protein EW146_g3256 [Bondarzewia mesenterica]